MKLEPNQSSSSPRSITTWRQPRPSAINARPMVSICRFGWLATQGGSSTRAVTAKKVNAATGMLMKKIQRQEKLSVM